MNEPMHQQPTQELAQRTGAGLEVTLFWSAANNSVSVVVVDRVAEERLEIPVSRDRASYAFHHPFAYAAEQGVNRNAVVRQAA